MTGRQVKDAYEAYVAAHAAWRQAHEASLAANAKVSEARQRFDDASAEYLKETGVAASVEGPDLQLRFAVPFDQMTDVLARITGIRT